MEDRYHEGEITEEVIREWAYDEYMWLSEQDEDLVFYDEKLLPIIVELGSDPNCLKGSDMLLWFTDFVRGQNKERRDQIIEAAIGEVKRYKSSRLSRWLNDLKIIQRL